MKAVDKAVGATVQEAVADAEISQQEEATEGSIQTTERYLGCKQKLRVAVND